MIIEVIYAGKKMKHAFVNPYAADGQTFGSVHLDQSPAPQRRRRRKRTPVCIGKNSQGETEVWKRPARIALYRRDEADEARVQFHAGAQQQDRSFKR